MKKATFRVSSETKEQILKRIKEDGIPVAQAAEDHGISTKTIYQWLTKGVTKPVSWNEYNKIKKENQDLKTFIGEITVELSKSKKKI
jgi:transposase-like protein